VFGVLHAEDVPFWLVSPDGYRALIEPNESKLLLPEHDLAEHPRVNDENPEFSKLLRQFGIRSTMYMGIANEHKFLERSLRPGDPVVVDGCVVETERRGGASGYRDGTHRVPTFRATPKNPMFLLPP
jgi:hypothetical protein